MGTLCRHATLAILDYLDQALEQTRRHDGPRLECHASWCIGRARDELLRAALADVAVEPAQAGQDIFARVEAYGWEPAQ